MAVIQIKKFSGETPSASIRALGPDRAAVARNLYPRSDEFRPLNSDVDVATIGLSNPKSLFRHDRNADGTINTSMTASWIPNAEAISYAKCQIDDDKTDRTCISYVPNATTGVITQPHVRDVTGGGYEKVLGIPPPAKPVVTVLVNDEYTPEEKSVDIQAAWAAVAAVVKSRVVKNLKTGPFQQDITHGYADGDEGYQNRFYDVPNGNSYVTGSPGSPLVPWAAFQDWVTDSNTIPVTVSISGTPTNLRAIAFRAYYRGCTLPVSTTTMAGELADIKIRGKSLFTTSQVTDFITVLQDYISAPNAATSTIDSFNTGISELRALLDGKRDESKPAEFTAFYAKTENADIISTEIYTFCKKLADAAHAYVVANGNSASLSTEALWKSGDTAAVVTSLRAGILALFVARADGAKVLTPYNYPVDLAALKTGISGVEVPFQIDVGSEYKALENAINPIGMSKYPDFPKSWATRGSTAASAVRSKALEVLRIAETLDKYFAVLYEGGDKLKAIIDTFFTDSTVIKNLPETLTRIVSDRYYVTTWVTNWGEESSPSPPSDLVSCDQNDVCVVTLGNAVPASYGIIGWRLYRSNSGSVGTGFQLVSDLSLIAEKNYTSVNMAVEADRRKFVEAIYLEIGRLGTMANVTTAEIDYWTTGSVGWTAKTLRDAMIAAARTGTGGVNESAVVQAIANALVGGNSIMKDGDFFAFPAVSGTYFSGTAVTAATFYNDALKSSQLQNVLETATWLQPPVRLQGITNMANGIMAGFFDNILCFSEAYVPYAWPVEYQIPIDFLIVGIGAFGNTLFVGTTSAVYIVSGSDPASMSAPVMSGSQACVSARSIVPVDGGVIYASINGLCFVTLSGVKVISEVFFSRADWVKIDPSSIVAIQHDNMYYFLYSGNGGGCYAVDLETGKLIEVDIVGSAFYQDSRTDTLYVAHGFQVTASFASSDNHKTGKYKTGIAKFNHFPSFAWLQVDSTFDSNTYYRLDGVTHTPIVTVKWYGDGTLRHTAVLTDREPVRLPPGIYREHEIEIESSSRITSVTLAGDLQELQSAN